MQKTYLILLIIFFLLWIIGLTDVIKHIRKPKRRKKEWAAFIFVSLVNVIAAVLWLALISNQFSLLSIDAGLTFIQDNGGLFGVFISGSLLGIWILSWNLLNDYLKIRITWTLIFLISLIVMLFANSPINSLWRTWAAGFFFTFIGIEIVLQILTIPGWLPSYPIFQSGIYHQYGRIYQKKEGFTNGTVNRYGLHQADQKINFDPNTRRIVLIGGSYLQGYQVSKKQHLAYQLEKQITNEISTNTQVISLGMPDAGIGLYMHDLLFDVIIEKFQPDEVIFFLHASSDFQCDSAQFRDPILYDLENEIAVLRSEDAKIRHAFQHIVIRGYHDPLDPLRILRTHLLLPKLLQGLLRTGSRLQLPQNDDSDDAISAYTAYVIRKFRGNQAYYQDFIAVPSINIDGYRNFLFEKEANDNALKSYSVTKSLYHQIFEYLDSKNIKLKVVTIPALSQKFINQEGDWSTLVGNYDLSTTERVSKDIARANSVDFLGMWGQFKKDHLSTSRIKSFYFDEGKGHFSPEGHKYFAERIYTAFYASESNSSK